MNTDLSQYRLTDLSQFQPFKEKIGERQFYNYAIGVYERLIAMNPGDTFDITKKVLEENRDMFVKIACCYIIDQQTPTLFNDTFTIIKRYNEPTKMDKTGKKVCPESDRQNEL